MSDSPDSHAIKTPIVTSSSLRKLPLMSAVLAAIGAIVLIVSEIWLTAIATIWALHGLLAANLTVDIVLGIAILPVAVWATWKTVVLAIEAEIPTTGSIDRRHQSVRPENVLVCCSC